MKRRDGAIALVWENFGPSHVDRCEALALRYQGRARVIGIEICGSSCTYEWTAAQGALFVKQTLFPARKMHDVTFFPVVFRIIRACIKGGARHVFICHYQDPSIFFTAVLLRLMGQRVYVMNDSKFDDYTRSLWLELAKAVFYLPYVGALAGSERTKDYMRFLGMRPDRIEIPYNAISVARISQSDGPENLADVAFDDRHFTIVARLVLKKNIATAIAAYALYYRNVKNPRSLHIFGAGPLDIELQTQAENAGLAGQVHFHGFVQAADIAEALRHSLALLLPSVEEQFGLAALEALCAGVPVIVSRNCGVCDAFVRTGVNGFIVEPTNVEGFAFFLTMLADDEALWSRMRAAARLSAGPGDVKCFATAVERLIDKTS